MGLCEICKNEIDPKKQVKCARKVFCSMACFDKWEYEPEPPSPPIYTGSAEAIAVSRAMKEIRQIFGKGDRVKVVKWNSSLPRYGTVIGYGSFLAPHCVRVVFDGCTTPITLSSRFCNHTDVKLPRSLTKIVLGALV